MSKDKSINIAKDKTNGKTKNKKGSTLFKQILKNSILIPIIIVILLGLHFSNLAINYIKKEIAIYSVNLISFDECEVTGFHDNKERSLVIIPTQCDGYSIIGIGTGAFSGNDVIKAVIIPPNVTYIGRNAFRDCKNLDTLFLPKSVTILEGAFSNCPNLEFKTYEELAEEIVPHLNEQSYRPIDVLSNKSLISSRTTLIDFDLLNSIPSTNIPYISNNKKD